VHFTQPAWEDEFRQPFFEALDDVLSPKAIIIRRDGKERMSNFMPELPPENVKGDYALDSPVTVQEDDNRYETTLSWDFSTRTLRQLWPLACKGLTCRGASWGEDTGSEAVLIDMPRLSATAQTPEKTAHLFELKVREAIDNRTRLLCVVCRDYSIPDITLRNICLNVLPHSALRFEAEPGLDFPTPLSLPRFRPWRALSFKKV